ncbi:MAG: hypothetical protein D6805_04550 [Planctomycetota bacterium]|nr:MAG: hypothetical protein D6805_04550 [Planctomycetota bacterium]
MYNYKDLTITIVGSGIAGAYAAGMLAKDQYNVILLDAAQPEQLPFLPVFPSTYSKYMFLWSYLEKFQSELIPAVRFVAPNGRSALVRLPHPILVLHRDKLQCYLQNFARQSGASYYPLEAKVIQEEDLIVLEKEEIKFQAQFFIGAEGLSNLIRTHYFQNTEKTFSPKYSLVVFTVVDKRLEENFLTLQWLPQPQALIWSLPSGQHTVVGVKISPPLSALFAEKTLQKYLRRVLGISSSPPFSQRYIPFLATGEDGSVDISQVMGPNWALLGSAAGLSEPLMGVEIAAEIYSAYYFCDAFSAIRPSHYPRALAENYLQHAMQIHSYLQALSDPFRINRFVSVLRHSSELQEIVASAFSQLSSSEQIPAKIRSRLLKILWQRCLG